MYILSASNLMPSARLLAKKLEEEYRDGKITVSSSIPNGQIPDIRWGTSAFAQNADTDLNSPELIRNAGNKARFSQVMTEKGIPHVELHTGIPDKFPVIVRTQLNRGGGVGMFVAENREQFSQWEKYSWSYFYNFSMEVGVHLLGGKVTKVFKKIREEGLPEEKYPRRNTNNGYRFSLINIENFKKLEEFCNRFYEAFPIQMGRADIGWVPEEKTWRIIEFNSAPDLTQNQKTLEMYVDFLVQNL